MHQRDLAADAARLREIVQGRTAADWLEDQLAAAGARAPAAP